MERIQPGNRAAFFIVSALACTSALVFTTACGKANREEAKVPEAPSVAVARVTRQDLSRDVVLTAEFLPFQEVDVMAKVAGYVKEIRVDVGDRVSPGQVLATIEIPEMQDDMFRARATIDQAETEVEAYRDEIRRLESARQMTHLSYQRLAGVVKERPGLIAQQEIDDAQGRDQMAEAQLAGANSRLASALKRVSVTKAEEARVKTMLAYTQVIAPFAGVITKRYANTGAMIQAGTASQTQAMPLVTVSQNSLLRLILPVPESIVPLVKVGQAVTVRVPTLSRTFSGRVARFSDKVQSSTRTMETEVDVQNPTYSLVAGMYAEAVFPTANRAGALTVPITAVDLNTGSDTKGKVMLVIAEGTLEVRDVLLGLETADRYEVLSGVNEGDAVVTGNRGTLRAGQRVRPKSVADTAAAR